MLGGGYFAVIGAAALCTLSFAAAKAYQQLTDNGTESGLKFNIITGAVTAAVFFAINGFGCEINGFSVLMAFAMAAFASAYTMVGFKIMSCGKMSLYTIFLMIGGMVVPYIWGAVFWGERPDLMCTAGLFVLIAAVYAAHGEGKGTGARLLALCMTVFLLNGLVSVVSKAHQISQNAVSALSFVILTGIAKAVICAAILVCTGKSDANNEKRKTPPRALWYTALGAVLGGASYQIQLKAAETMPASVLYPLITGGTIFCSAVIARLIFGEKISKRIALSMALCMLGVFLLV